ncbi:MAG: type II toxin-antitoxin system RelB/DinJ family antitoxin [Kiritimatiellae bacterium]|nr:type II toxin-antitoxin system RelB/DinJ family antitoxin [Kiritimatiellia bacterium]
MSQVSFRIDDQLKADGERLFKSMGMNMSVAITVFIQQSLLRGKLPFEVVGDPFYSDSNMRELERRAREMDAHQNVSEHELLEAEEPVHA